jgi:ribosomal-protein-alanine N-acetyltransferase
MPATDLTTERMRLRLSTPLDTDALWHLWRLADVRKYLWDDRLISHEEAADVVTEFVEAARTRGLGLWMLEGLAAGEWLGFVALREIEQTGEVELIYGLMPEAWARGLAGEASRAVIAYAFDGLALPRVWARTDAPNARSIRVAERLGMRRAEDPGETDFVSFVLQRPSTPLADALSPAAPG